MTLCVWDTCFAPCQISKSLAGMQAASQSPIPKAVFLTRYPGSISCVITTSKANCLLVEWTYFHLASFDAALHPSFHGHWLPHKYRAKPISCIRGCGFAIVTSFAKQSVIMYLT